MMGPILARDKNGKSKHLQRNPDATTNDNYQKTSVINTYPETGYIKQSFIHLRPNYIAA